MIRVIKKRKICKERASTRYKTHALDAWVIIFSASEILLANISYSQSVDYTYTNFIHENNIYY